MEFYGGLGAGTLSMAGDCNVYALFAVNVPIIRMVYVPTQKSFEIRLLTSLLVEGAVHFSFQLILIVVKHNVFISELHILL